MVGGIDNGRQKTEIMVMDVIVGGELFTDYSDHLATVTLKPKLKSTGAGRYQLLSRWWMLTALKPFERLSPVLKDAHYGLRSVALYL